MSLRSHCTPRRPNMSAFQVNNLEERVKIDTMKEALTRVFQYYGPILDIIAKSSLKRKGQAFVVFDSEKSALDAVEEMNGFELYGKAIKVSRAKTHSDETVKRKAGELFEEHKRKRLMLKGVLSVLWLMCSLSCARTALHCTASHLSAEY